jgi:hypothetical protein
VESADREFLDEAAKYYHSLKQVDDLTAVDAPVVKVAVFAFGSAEDAAPGLFTGEDAAAPEVDEDQRGGDLRGELDRHHAYGRQQGCRPA